MFGEVWGIGPATALKLYEKGHRTLDDLKNEDSLTNAQRTGLNYFDDIKTRIPRHEVWSLYVFVDLTLSFWCLLSQLLSKKVCTFIVSRFKIWSFFYRKPGKI